MVLKQKNRQQQLLVKLDIRAVFYNLSPVCFVTKHKTIKHFQRLLCVLKVPHVKRGYELLCDEYSAAPPLPAMSLQLPGFYFPWRKMKVSSRLPFLLYD